MFSSGQFKMSAAPVKPKPEVEEMTMTVDEPETPKPERSQPRKRTYRETYRDDVGRYRQRYDYEGDSQRRTRDRQMEDMSREYGQMRAYGRRQKLKKTAIKRQAKVMARALGESENNVRILSSYVKRFSQPRMTLIHFPSNSQTNMDLSILDGIDITIKTRTNTKTKYLKVPGWTV